MRLEHAGDQWPKDDGDRLPAEPAPRTLDRVAGGDLAALAEVYESHGARAYRLAFQITGSRSDAQDVVQDLFIALPEALATFRGEGSFGAWLRSCAARQALVHLRTRRRRREIDLDPDWLPAGSPVPALERIDLETALARLPDSLRVVVVFRDIEGFSHDEIAAMLGISAAASRMRLMRARKQLRNLIAPPGAP